ncbi:glycogen debranching N-terminal domain-containing protein [Pseudolysinimonas sp.]|uniref:glycogen debranching N-terminal domain-containing protein n=1 Tax=Pseudolysinimonas sp. TaxID=2680009 RepID=UPI003C766E71
MTLRAPAQAWSRSDGSMGAGAIDGVYVSDVRVLRTLDVTVDGASPEHIATLQDAADRSRFVSLLRGLDDVGADPDVRGELIREVTPSGARHTFTLSSRLTRSVTATIRVALEPALDEVQVVKSGMLSDPPATHVTGESATWGGGGIAVVLQADGADLREAAGVITAEWSVEVPPQGAVSIAIDVRATDDHAVVAAPAEPPQWANPATEAADDRLRRWVHRSLGDLDALRLTTTSAPDFPFVAAGAPWFFTLFGRDALWVARFLVPLGSDIPIGTLRSLAALQGTTTDPESAEQPGKILHELRRGEFSIPGESLVLPPRYFGTVDATALWICLLADLHKTGYPLDGLREFRPALEAALTWMRDFGDSDGDGLLEYIDESGHGLSNQGWKDSSDSVQWRDGTLAEGPLALCEVQAYAVEAALGGAELLDALGGDGKPWRGWAKKVTDAFRASFWVETPEGRYPAIALDGAKRAVDTLTSNVGHLLGTGLLDSDESRLVATHLTSPALSSGYGVRTLSIGASGFWPLGYHVGSVWTHDTAIAVRGLVAGGFHAEAAQLTEGLLRAAVAFDYRIPELYSGDAAADVPAPVPYPAACRPQGWSAASAIAVLSASQSGN